ncbi:DUF2207 domain-containing protein [Agrobacterium sp. Ap1]|uniref:DUF2207 domain-containing protein n=1 Tax=Agrobacterium sp. Ap1 TaxID=2815337 RepID=UPI001A8D4049|nr:DUF2207 domain-containing protein [Agrobacterium sp. Ap1]MBO0140446.1 DUF2207 domain-containing protein [Agrobacterium sp. Ap1]
MFRRLVLALVLALAGYLPAAAEEYIRSYNSDIQIAADGELTVTETITVNAEGNRIRRGIFRDFPMTMEDAKGRTIRVGFEPVSVTRDGRPEAFHTETISRGIRIYTGGENTFLSPGVHTYAITYRTNRQIRYFDDHDELYWNATGNGWQFRIAQASARVTLPGGRVTDTTAFTGAYRSTASDVRASASGSQATFTTTRPLGSEEGLTIVVGFPKGIVTAPSADQESAWWWRDNRNLFLALGGLAVVAFYYFMVWRRVGRDPQGGVIVPRWDTPAGISPALVNYIDNKGFSGGGWTAFSASLLDLAVKGYLTLEDLKSRVVVRISDRKPLKDLPSGQKSMLFQMGAAGDTFAIEKSNGERVQEIGKAFRQAIEKEHRGKYYRHNTVYVVLGVLLSLMAAAALLIFGDIDPDDLGLLLPAVLFGGFWSFFAVTAGKSLLRKKTIAARIVAIISLAMFGLVAFSIGGTFIVGAIESVEDGQWPVFAGIGGLVLINVLFFFLMGAPTPLGRKLMDEIEGLRTYLTVAEKDRMNMAGAPSMSPQHFEKLLPYAVALGVEKPWSEAFEAWLATAVAAGAAAYSSTWYHGDGFGSFGDRIGGFSSSMSQTIQSTIPTPKSSLSSSGFSTGGGFSGGGGGGGGGGGW